VNPRQSVSLRPEKEFLFLTADTGRDKHRLTQANDINSGWHHSSVIVDQVDQFLMPDDATELNKATSSKKEHVCFFIHRHTAGH